VLLVLDDCQWADRLTVRLLTALCESGEPLPAGLGVVVAFRSDEVPVDFPLRTLTRATALRPGPLPAEAMASLAESMAGPLPDEVLQTVVRLADGSPFMGAAVLRGLVESGALVGSATGWTVDPVALADVQAARRAAAVLVRRLELLPEQALALLSVGAVLGKEFDIELAVQLAGSPLEAAAAIEEARQRRLVWLDERSGRCAFFHDKIREALLERLEGQARRALHGRAAEALLAAAAEGQEASAARVFELAYHFDAAGRSAEALPHALAAAELARGQHALDTALTHYQIAERGVDAGDTATRRRIAEGMGDVCTLQGSYAEAERQLLEARRLVELPAEEAALEGRLGRPGVQAGRRAMARAHLESALHRLGRPVPAQAWWLVLRLLGELLVQAAHTLLPRWTTGRRSPVGREQDFLAMRLYSRLAYVHWFGSGRVPCAWAHLRGMTWRSATRRRSSWGRPGPSTRRS
jgi:two-component system sensor kinase